MKGTSRIRTERILPLNHRACHLAQMLYVVVWKWLPRKYNKAADQLTRIALREFRSDPISVE